METGFAPRSSPLAYVHIQTTTANDWIWLVGWWEGRRKNGSSWLNLNVRLDVSGFDKWTQRTKKRAARDWACQKMSNNHFVWIWVINLLWRWGQYVPKKRWYPSTSPHGVTTKKTKIIPPAVRTWSSYNLRNVGHLGIKLKIPYGLIQI
jgi:hypothetical protein